MRVELKRTVVKNFCVKSIVALDMKPLINRLSPNFTYNSALPYVIVQKRKGSASRSY